MSMEISNNYSNYAKSGTSTAKEGNVTTSTVELKTSTGGTKTEQIKTGYSNVNDYSKYLKEKYSYMNTGTTSMQGVPTTVSVSGAFLKKCMNDPEKAKYLEENLAAIPDSVKSLCNSVKMAPGSPVVTYATCGHTGGAAAPFRRRSPAGAAGGSWNVITGKWARRGRRRGGRCGCAGAARSAG